MPQQHAVSINRFATSLLLTFAGLKYNELGSFDYGRNYGVAYDAAAYTDMLVEWGGDSWASADNFMNGRTNGVATYRNYDFFGLVDGLDFAEAKPIDVKSLLP